MQAGRLTLAATSLALLAGGSSCGEEPWEWELVWADEFEGEAGTPPDPARWGFDVGTGWGNQQLEFDTDRVENASHDGEGNLAIVAREEAYEGADYTSARITTAGRFARARGRFEARIKLPVGRGIWPAFWLLGSNFDAIGWPACGEIDVMEYRGQEPRVVHGSLHGPGYSGGNARTGSYRLESGDFAAGFNVFGIEWSEDRITWLVNGRRYQTVTSDDLPEGSAWVFHHPFFIILNVAVGGTYVGPPDESTTFPQTMLVDWVRVYRGED